METTRLDTPYIALFYSTVPCDGGCGQEAAIVTDGIRAYVETIPSQIGALVSRNGTVLLAACPHTPCHGTYEWHLDEPGCWSSDPTLRLSMPHAEKIDVA